LLHLPYSRACSTFHQLRGHKSRVSCIGVNTSGQALCTGSWDTELAVWA
jgi:WD40 repeat protein